MNVLISVSDKRGLIPFVQSLQSMGCSIISTGGTASLLNDNGVSVTPIQDVTQFPEMLDGRVKTLHPNIHGGLLARRDKPTHMQTCSDHGIQLIDMVVVNLYPFAETVARDGVSVNEAVEQIDIGGPSMIRSAAKNYASVGIVVNPDRYDAIIKEMESNDRQLSDSTRANLAGEAFSHTAHYDSIIASYFQSNILSETSDFSDRWVSVYEKQSELRYGENPHQSAAVYVDSAQQSRYKFQQLHGKELSYNNYIDLDAAYELVKEFQLPAAVVIKHTNPCGVAVADNISDAYSRAHDADPVSAFGSIIGLNRAVDRYTADSISETFVEAVIAPSFDESALDILQKKKNIRLITVAFNESSGSSVIARPVFDRLLLQESNSETILQDRLETVTTHRPSDIQLNDLEFAYAVVKHVKSNAIVVAKNGIVLGVGAGQMSRIKSVEIALEKAGDSAKDAVLASDAFFPFSDSVELASQSGISAIVQPGGSKRDDESIRLCDEKGIAMVFTGLRHFKH